MNTQVLTNLKNDKYKKENLKYDDIYTLYSGFP